MVGMQQAVKPESPGLSRRREPAGIPVPNISRAATSDNVHGRTGVHAGKNLEWSVKPTGCEEHNDSNHELSRDDGNECGRTGVYTGRAEKGPICIPAGGAAIGSKLGLLLQRNDSTVFVRMYFKYPNQPELG